MVGLILSNYLYSEDKKILDIDKGFIRNIWNCEIRRRMLENRINMEIKKMEKLPLESGIDCGDNIRKEYNNNKESLNLSKKTVDLNEYERLKGVIDNMVLADYEDENEFNKAVKGLLNSSEYVVEGGSKENKELDCSGFIGKVYDELSSENLNDKVKGYNEEKCNKGDKSYCCSNRAKPCDKRSQKQYEYLLREGKIVDDITQIKPMSALYFEEVIGKENDKEKKEIVHTVLFEYYGKKGEPVESSKCTPDYCPIVVVSTSKGKPVEEKSIPLKNGCYSYCPTKRIKGKCPVSEKEQCFVGGGIP
jgi:hypothetical protein